MVQQPEWPMEICDLPTAFPRYELSTWENYWLHGGWIIVCLLIVLVLVGHTAVSGLINNHPSSHRRGQRETLNKAGAPRTMDNKCHPKYHLYLALWGDANAHYSFLELVSQGVILCLSLLNFYTFAIMTEAVVRPENAGQSPGVAMTSNYHAITGLFSWQLDATFLNYCLEYFSWGFFFCISWYRLANISIHPDWVQYGRGAAWRYAIVDVYMLLELCGLAMTVVDVVIYAICKKHLHFNLLWLFFARSLKFLQRGGAGIGLARLTHMIQANGRLLGVSYTMGLVIWLLMSGCYFAANREFIEDGGVWCAYVYPKPWRDPHGNLKFVIMPWGKFSSIPSSMWFVLINLVKEHPFADAHVTFAQRFWVCIVCMLAMPLFGLPTAVLQSSLVQIEKEEEPPEKNGEPGNAPIKRKILDPAKACATWRFHATWILTIWSIVMFFYFTARGMPHSTVCFMKVRVGPHMLCAVDAVVALIFLGEWVVRLSRGGWNYVSSCLGIIDAIAWCFGVLHMIVLLGGVNYESDAYQWLCAACVLRMFKFERYIGSFGLLRNVLMKNKYLFFAAFVLAMFLWMLVSTILYATERYSYDEEIVAQYGSVMRSLWSELINLSGEWPYGDYTAVGKAFTTLIALIAIMLFCIPISVFQASMEDLVLLDKRREGDKDLEKEYWQQRVRPEGHYAQRLHDVLYAHLYVKKKHRPKGYCTLRLTSVVMVTMNTIVTLMLTIRPHEAMSPHTSPGLAACCYFLDLVACAFFIFELVARTVATNCWHIASFTGWCDTISLTVLIVTLVPSLRSQGDIFLTSFEDESWSDDGVGLLRLLRIFSLESYWASFHAMKKVAWLARRPLLKTGCATVTIWFIHATLLWLCERPHGYDLGALAHVDEATDSRFLAARLLNATAQNFIDSSTVTTAHHLRSVWGYGIKIHVAETLLNAGVHRGSHPGTRRTEELEDPASQSVAYVDRYSDVLRALQYSVVHLFGDFPVCDYKFTSKIIHFIGILGGMSIIAAFCGVFTAGFMEYVREARTSEIADRAFTRLFAAIRAAKRLQRNYRARKLQPNYVPPSLVRQSAWKSFCRSVVERKIGRGRCVMLFFNGILIFNLSCCLIATLPPVDRKTSQVLRILEVMCTAVFCFEYAIRITASVKGSWYRSFRLLDLLCLFPGIIYVVVEVGTGQARTEEEENCESVAGALMVVRAVRVLDFSYWRREMVVISRSLNDSKTVLAQPAYLAICTWVVTSALFMWLEHFSAEHFPDDVILSKSWGESKGRFASVPDTMYWCCIYLTGEWAHIDFSFMGSRLCIFYVFFGVTFFSIPCAIIVETVQANLAWVQQEEKQIMTIHESFSQTVQDKAIASAGLGAAETIFLRRPSVQSRRAADTARKQDGSRRVQEIELAETAIVSSASRLRESGSSEALPAYFETGSADAAQC